MFSIKRFDAFGPGNDQGGASDQSKHAALQARIAARARAAGEQPAAAEPAKPTPPSAPAPARVPAPAPREKTKAKQRYLKAKKERRKAKKSAGPKPFGQGKKKHKRDDSGLGMDVEPPPKKPKQKAAEVHETRETEEGSGSDEEKVESEESDSTSESESETESDEAENVTAGKKAQQSPPPEPTEIQADALQPAPEPMPESPTSDAEEITTSSPDTPSADTDSGVLYQLPAPRRTADADAQALTAQGIPKELAHPTVVDAALSQSIHDEGNSGTQRTEECGGVPVSRTVKRQLERLGIQEWFAVQAAVIPRLLGDRSSHSLSLPYAPPRDLCVSAPTGSGKTLAYTVPIVETLQVRVTVQLRALILVPTRDLALQVMEMFEAIGKGSGLRTALITGNHSFRHEQAQLVQTVEGMPKENATYSSKVDVLIATPGRLVDHIRGTPGFTLQHLRFLVIDEADRLLSQSFQQWVPTLLAALEPSAQSAKDTLGEQAPPWLYAEAARSGRLWTQDDMDKPAPSVQKLLFSATLTRDPAKMNALRLRAPLYLTVQDRAAEDMGAALGDRFALPASLREHMVIAAAGTKLLKLLHLLHHPVSESEGHTEPVRHALCFTKSVESAKRLVRLLTFFEEGWAAAHGERPIHLQHYSSELGPSQRIQMLRQFKQGQIDLLVCSDLISRGIDLPDVRHVVSYDAPVDMAKYVHRVGRTARAGRTGDAWVLVEEHEVCFWPD